jgi:hypothetical protein
MDQKAPLRRKPSLRMLRRLEKIESLSANQQFTLLKTIDILLRGATSRQVRGKLENGQNIPDRWANAMQLMPQFCVRAIQLCIL